MNVTPRLQQILLLMLKKDEKISIKQLAEEIGVSKRTAQRELEYVQTVLKKYNIQFQSKTGTGVWLEGTLEDKQRLMQELDKEDAIDSVDRSERRKRLILEILKDRTPQKLYYYGNLFGVSEATISTDMDAVESWFETFRLKIVRKQGYGVVLEGSEKDYRRAMRHFIDENIDTEMIRDVYDNKEDALLQVLGNRDKRNMYRILDRDILKRVISCVVKLNDRYITNLTENSYIGLILHVTIAVNRILKKEIIEENPDLLSKLQKDEEYESALCIGKALEEEFRVQIPSIETAYIWLHLKGAKRQHLDLKSNGEESGQVGDQQMIVLLNRMIEAYDSDFAYVLKQDDEFIRGILAHLSPTMVRLMNGMTIANPLLDQIKTDYALVYKKCKKVAKVLEEELQCRVPETEIGFLAIHFGAALVRLDDQKEKKRVVVVGVICASGIGISQLMCTKIKKIFSSRVELTAYGTSDITPYIEEKTDFFVSSIPTELENAKVLYVSPLLVESDLEEIEKQIYKYERIAKPRQEEVFTRQLEQVNYVAAQIKTIIKDMFCMRVCNDSSFEQLLNAMTGRITARSENRLMIQRDIMAREQLSTQIFPAFGFALLHTRTRGVVKPGFFVCLTNDLKAFSDPYFQQINVVILMLLPQDENVRLNSEIMGFLSAALIEEMDFLEIIESGEEEEIREEVSRQLKKYFYQYLDKI